ncbi:PAS domain-containing protein [Vulgatibacter sp.]|uniref:PAS domain-containing protein n=1 Tax=Vulgatibacter sp. TaxID=1971226 RepID=UPI00356B1FB3
MTSKRPEGAGATTPAFDFAAIFELSPNPYMLLDRQLRYVAMNQAYLDVTASRREELLGQYIFDVFPNDPDDRANPSARLLRSSFDRVLETGQRDTLALIPYRVPRKFGDRSILEDHFWSATHTPLLDERGEVAFILQHTVNVTELQQLKEAVRQAEEARAHVMPLAQKEAGVLHRARQVQDANRILGEERAHLLRLFEQSPGFICFLRGPEHVFEIANNAYLQLVGHRDVIGKRIRDALPEIVEQGYLTLLDQVFESGRPFVGRGARVTLQAAPHGPLEEFLVDFAYQPILEADGTVAGIFVSGHDITEQKRAHDELARYRHRLEQIVAERTRALEASEAERRQTETALRHAQKMEAVGNLTGGVAHDFNNLLQVIGGNLQLLARELEGQSRALRRIETAARAVDRGASLASQLLAFARRQPLDPVVLHLGHLVACMDDLLRRVLGEDIDLHSSVAEGLWNTLADSNQIENVVLNLAINARDAMEGRGLLRISASNATIGAEAAALAPDIAPGEYVCLTIADTGCGMTPEVLERACEPFFTTKPEGRGTGLGLSTVYGFVKQTGGHMRIWSQVGVGTSITIYLPRTEGALPVASQADTSAVEGGSETILVVEDDPDVRATAVEMLGALGYRVLEAPNGEAGLALFEQGAPIDLLFSDVVMPGPVRSTEMADRARALRPGLRVLFASGYAENAVVHGGRIDEGVHLLNKPYRREELARKVRQLLGTSMRA